MADADKAKIEVKDQDTLGALRDFLKRILEEGKISALMVTQHLPRRKTVMPTLVTDPQKLDGADPLAPVFPLNSAKMVSKLTRRPLNGRVAVVLRPCEVRAFIELVKLKQGRIDDVVLIGMDCYGAYSNINYPRLEGADGKRATLKFLDNSVSGKDTNGEDFDISPACKACEYPVAESADLLIGLIGVDINNFFYLEARTETGRALLEVLDLPGTAEPEGRQAAIKSLVEGRRSYRDRMYQETSEATSDLQKLTAYLANCVNCYNCRVACPVCYCKECVFQTDVFDHEPAQYLRWAERKGILKVPTDTVFYHLTRMAHMSTACIGCGQCSNACPNNIPVMEIFRTVAGYTQKAFDYQPGRSLEDEPPLSVFREKEFPEVTEGKD